MISYLAVTSLLRLGKPTPLWSWKTRVPIILEYKVRSQWPCLEQCSFRCSNLYFVFWSGSSCSLSRSRVNRPPGQMDGRVFSRHIYWPFGSPPGSTAFAARIHRRLVHPNIYFTACLGRWNYILRICSFLSPWIRRAPMKRLILIRAYYFSSKFTFSLQKMPSFFGVGSNCRRWESLTSCDTLRDRPMTSFLTPHHRFLGAPVDHVLDFMPRVTHFQRYWQW